MLSDTQKIGASLLVFGIVIMIFGMMMLFDGGLLALGNILFLVGISLLMGYKRLVSFFRKRKLRGVIAFFAGVMLIFVKYPKIGISVELFGFINLFGDFFPVAVAFLRKLPVIGHFLELPVIKKGVDFIAGNDASMSTSGVSVNDACLSAFNELKTKSKYKYIAFQLNSDESQIVTEKSVENGTWEDFVNGLPKNDCRYIVYDFEYEPSEGGIRKKIIFIFWSPDAAKIRTKMIYASSEESLKSKLNVQTRIQANDFSDLDFNSILSRICNAK